MVSFVGADAALAHDGAPVALKPVSLTVDGSDAPSIELVGGHCHAGPTCGGVAAITIFQIPVEIQLRIETDAGAVHQTRTYELAGFDPPPPRTLPGL